MHLEVEGNIADSNVRYDTVKEQLKVMLLVLIHRRVLILAPYYLYIGLFFSLWTSIVPTTFQFTKALSLNVYIPAYFGIMFTIGCVSMSLLTMKLAAVMKDFSLKPLMVISVCLHSFVHLRCDSFPEWSAVRPNDEPSLLVQPTMSPILLLAFMFGVADAANNSTRAVISSMLLPTTRQQTFGASPFYHGLAAGLLLFVAPSLSVYAYVVILTVFLAVSTVVFFHSCNFIRGEEGKAANILTEINLRVTEKGPADNAAFLSD